jgi:hypothetical protein
MIKKKHQENIRIRILPYWGDGKWECCNAKGKKVMMTTITIEWEHYDAKIEKMIMTTRITKREHYEFRVNIATNAFVYVKQFHWILIELTTTDE